MNHNRGQALILMTVLLAVVLSSAILITGNVLRQQQVTKLLDADLEAQNAAEAGLAKAIWCLNQTNGDQCGGSFGLNYAGETNLNLGIGTVTITVTGAGNRRTLTAIGKSSNGLSTKKITATAEATPRTSNLTFNFSSQIGSGGLEMGNSSRISGSIYSNGPINCGSGATITVDAVSADPIPGNSQDDGSKIEGCIVQGTAKAYTIKNSTISGDAYYRSITNSTVSGTRYPDSPEPTVQSFPISDGQIQLFKDDAARGGVINGDFNPSSSNPVNLGPKKITRNLILDNNETLVVTGTIWVQGNLDISNNSVILTQAYGNHTGTIIVDGWVHLDNNTNLSGSGQPSSYLMILSLAAGGGHHDSAIDLHNNVVGPIFYAPNGTINVHQNGQVKELVAKKVKLDNSAVINYESGIATTVYSAGTGGNWTIRKGTWTSP